MELITDLGKQIKYRKGHCQISTLWVGIDIGSTTVKIAAIDPQSRISCSGVICDTTLHRQNRFLTCLKCFIKSCLIPAFHLLPVAVVQNR